MKAISCIGCIAVMLLSLLWSCDQKKEKVKEDRFLLHTSRVGHYKMVALLDSLDKEADPKLNYHMNKERASYYQQQARNASEVGQHINMTFQYALQLMYAAEVDQAIQVLESLLQQYNIKKEVVPENLKPLVEYLGIAYLRKGELDNCVVNHVSTSCIVPLHTSAHHIIPTGSEKAKSIFTSLLQQYPNDAALKYWLNLAHMTLGEYPGEVPRAYHIPQDIFEKDEFPFFINRATDLHIDVNGIAGGVVMDDFNNDGRYDLMVSSYYYGDPIQLFLQTESGFKESSIEAGLTGITGGLHLMLTDYNNDGHSDVWIMRGGWLGNGGKLPNSLLQNNGDGTFSDVTLETQLLSFNPSQSSVWADFNNDGWLDVFVANESGQFVDANGQGGLRTSPVSNPSQLFLNQQDGTFTEVGEAWNADIVGFIKGVAMADYDGDGWVDLYLSRLDGPNLLLHNEEGKSFVNVAKEAGVTAPLASFPCAFWDINNDGWEDLFVGGYDVNTLHTSPAGMIAEYTGDGEVTSTPKVYLNNGNGTFNEMSKQIGLHKSLYAMGLNYGDLDNDGWLDLYVGTGTPNLNAITPNRMFLNKKGTSFEEVSNAGFAHIQKGHGVSFGDLDNDGDQDIYAVMGGAYEGDYAQNILLENPGQGNHWLRLELQGTKSNRPAIGARVKVTVQSEEANNRSIWQTVSNGASFGSNSLPLEIGLGKASSIEVIQVFWPSGKVSKYAKPIDMDNTYSIREGDDTLTKVELPKIKWPIPQGHGPHQH